LFTRFFKTSPLQLQILYGFFQVAGFLNSMDLSSYTLIQLLVLCGFFTKAPGFIQLLTYSWTDLCGNFHTAPGFGCLLSHGFWFYNVSCNRILIRFLVFQAEFPSRCTRFQIVGDHHQLIIYCLCNLSLVIVSLTWLVMNKFILGNALLVEIFISHKYILLHSAQFVSIYIPNFSLYFTDLEIIVECKVYIHYCNCLTTYKQYLNF